MINLKFILFLVMFSAQLLQAQDYVFFKEFKVTEDSKIVLDHFSNFYILQESEIIKYNKDAKEIYRFTDEYLNENIQLDVSDPFKPLVFNQDFYNLKILDNRLGIINEIYLNEVYDGLVSVITSSSAQEYWIYDKQDNKLKNLNYDFEILKQSFAFQTIFDEFSDPFKLRIENEKLYLLDKFGIKVFDLFGNHLSSLSIKNIESFQIINQEIIYFENQELKSYNPITLNTKTLKLPLAELEIFDVKLSNKLLFIKENKLLKIYAKK